jgi:hypothetical protein
MIYNILDAFVIVFSCLSFVLGTLSLRGNASGWCVQLYPTGVDPSEKKTCQIGRHFHPGYYENNEYSISQGEIAGKFCSTNQSE